MESPVIVIVKEDSVDTENQRTFVLVAATCGCVLEQIFPLIYITEDLTPRSLQRINPVHVS